jgi:integrase
LGKILGKYGIAGSTMSRKYLMKWRGKPYYLWRKMYKGVRYTVTCEQLNAPVYTEEGSYRLANAWWQRKLGELQPKIDPTIERLQGYEIMDLVEAIQRGQAAQLLLAAKNIQEYEKRPNHELDSILEAARGSAEIFEGQPVPADQSVGTYADKYLAVERARGKAPATYADLAKCLGKLLLECPHLNRSTAAEKISEETLTATYTWLRTRSGWADKFQSKSFGYLKRMLDVFIGWKLLQPLANMRSRMFTFNLHARPSKTWPLAEVREMLARLTPRLKLYACLGLNCGMYPSDMGQIRQCEYDGKYISRKRTKTRSHSNVPLVSYLLWPETKALLDSYPRLHPEFVLCSKNGSALWRWDMQGDKPVRVDNITKQWRDSRGKKGEKRPTIPLSKLRSIGATLLESHPQHARFKTLYLGQAPATIAERHYAAYSQTLFDEALSWLRGEILGDGKL